MKFKARVPMSLPQEKTLGLILAFTLMAEMKTPWWIGHPKLFWNGKELWMIT
jgi:hypothetical protein